MACEYLMDTNAVIALRSNPESFRDSFSEGSRFYVSIFTIGELEYGSLYSARPDYNIAWLARFLESIAITPCDRATAGLYARLRLGMRRKGKPIPHNDVWIAATALQFGLTLITDDAHFGQVDGLQRVGWS